MERNQEQSARKLSPAPRKQLLNPGAAEHSSRSHAKVLFNVLVEFGLYIPHATATLKSTTKVEHKEDGTLHVDTLFSVVNDVCARAPLKKHLLG